MLDSVVEWWFSLFWTSPLILSSSVYIELSCHCCSRRNPELASREKIQSRTSGGGHILVCGRACLQLHSTLQEQLNLLCLKARCGSKSGIVESLLARVRRASLYSGVKVMKEPS